ncbi:Taurine-transporting ATPase [Bertholletia excelsa]
MHSNVPRWTPSPSPTRTPLREEPRAKDIVRDDPADSESMVSSEEEVLSFSHSAKPSFPFSKPHAVSSTATPNVPPPPPTPPLLKTIDGPSLRVDTQVKTQINQTSNISPSHQKLHQRSVDVEPLHVEHPPKREEQVIKFNDIQVQDDGYRSTGGGSPRSLGGWSRPPPSSGATPEDFQQVWKKNGGGVYLTWKDLWVTVPDKKGGRKGILQGVTGYVEPGEVLAIMGPSGCGKSTLLDALAGRLGSNTRQTGEILINGRRQTLSFGTSAYVTQDDTLMTTLTVKEAVYYSAQLQLPDSMSRSEKKERAEATIIEMGLQDAMNTRIGGWSSKGLSGGQKRRVSICMEILTRPKLLFLDEPTSGLDSAASYHVMNRIIKLAQQDRRTVIASIHQPSSEVFELFHNLCLLSSGRTVYFGSTSMANEFFASNGFPCPPMRNPSDHYLRTVNKDFDVDIEQGFGGKTSTTEAINILVKSYKASEANQQVQRRVQEINQQGGEALEKKGSQAGFITQCLVLTERSFVNMYRDLGYYWLRLAIYIALCLCVGTIFYDIGHSYGSIQARGSMLMFVAAFLTFMAIGGFPSFVEDMKIFTRERLNGHYGVGAFVVGNTLSSMPYLLLISVIPGAMAYYLVGLQKGIDHFAYFAVMLFACMLLVESLMMIVASIVPDFLMGIITGAGIQGVMMLNGGFFRLPNDLPKPFWKYPMYYIAFHKYANQGFYKNEFEGLTFPNNVPGGPPITGDEILRNTWEVQMGYSKWVDVGIVLGMVVLYRLMFLGIIKTVEKVKPMVRSLMAGAPKHSTYADDSSSTPLP